MGTKDLFGDASGDVKTPKKRRDPQGEARLMRADRHQVRLLPVDLDGLLDADHQARAIWRMVESLDLSKLEAAIRARGDNAGRPAIDPKILLTLWLHGLSEGVGSARELNRLCEAHNAYRWICGGVNVNYHALSDFRVDHQEALDDLMSQILGVMVHNGLVDLTRVAHDGMKVRASAGAASFRREKSLKKCLREASDHIRIVTRDAHDSEGRSRQDAAIERAAEEREERIQEALKQLPEARASKLRRHGNTSNPDDVRVSTTDPDARVMRMADGGFRPAYNVQLTTAVTGRAIVAVRVSNSGADSRQLPPSLDEMHQRTGALPQEVLADAAYGSKETIEDSARRGITLFAPPKPAKRKGADPYRPKPRDSANVAAWRLRMATPETKELYKQRAAVAETVNADLRTWRGLDQIPVRGLSRARSVALLAALTYNVLLLISKMTPTPDK